MQGPGRVNYFHDRWLSGSYTNVPFLYPLKTSEIKGLLTFSGGTETEHWAKMC